MNFLKKLLFRRHKPVPESAPAAEPTPSPSIFITYTEFQELLNQVISPVMLEKGFQYDGKYTWFSPMENHMRKSVSVFLLKGPAIFKWSVTFDFIPTPSGEQLRYSRTDKKVVAHLYEYPSDFTSSFTGGMDAWMFSPCKMSRSGRNRQDIIAQIKTAYACELERFEQWHSEFNTLEDALRMADAKIKTDGTPVFKFLAPSPVYVKAFLLAALGRNQEGLVCLEQYFTDDTFMSEEMKTKLRQKVADLRID